MAQTAAGPLALVGSGEYTPAMNETDLLLLDAVGGPGAARVVVLPTAAGLEDPTSPQRWADMGVRHFTALGAQVEAVMILNRDDAADPRWLPLLEQADFYYFSGGNPQHLVEAMQGTPAWEVILRRHLTGAALAGCSAGAMAAGGWTPTLQSLRKGWPVAFLPALSVLPWLMVMPHFDMMGRFIPGDGLRLILKNAPDGAILVGIDEDTALVRLPSSGASWQVSGRQTVSVFDLAASGDKTVYHAGQTVNLPG